MSPTAREVVAEYLAKKQAAEKPDAQRSLVQELAEEVIDELPDGFTAKDARACVALLTDDRPELADMSKQKRGRTVTKLLDGMVADGALKLDEHDQYAHV